MRFSDTALFVPTRAAPLAPFAHQNSKQYTIPKMSRIHILLAGEWSTLLPYPPRRPSHTHSSDTPSSGVLNLPLRAAGLLLHHIVLHIVAQPAPVASLATPSPVITSPPDFPYPVPTPKPGSTTSVWASLVCPKGVHLSPEWARLACIAGLQGAQAEAVFVLCRSRTSQRP